MRRFSAVILACSLIFCLLSTASCGADDDGSGTVDSVEIVVDGSRYDALKNVDSQDHSQVDVMVMDHDWVTDGVYLTGIHTERDIYTVTAQEGARGAVYIITSTDKTVAANPVPVNGFLLSVRRGAQSFSYGDRVESQTELAIGAESFSYCVMRVKTDGGRITRRVSLLDPATLGNNDVITLVTAAQNDITVPAGSVAYLVEAGADDTYKVMGKADGVISAGQGALVFGGRYNCAFAKDILESGVVVTVTGLDKVYGDTYKPHIRYEGKAYELAGELNSAPEGDGVYIYDTSYEGIVTPASEGFCAVVSEGKAVAATEPGQPAVVPTADAFAVLFSGAVCDAFSSLSVGDTLTQELCEVKTSVNVSKGLDLRYTMKTVPFTQFNGVRYTDYIVIYNQGASTGTNQYGYEISVSADGVMLDDSYAGDMSLPEGGYVLSGHGTGMEQLIAVYMRGAQVVVDAQAKQFFVVSSPLTKVSAVKAVYDDLEYRSQHALSLYLDFEYEKLQSNLTSAGSMLDEAAACMDSDPAAALALLDSTEKLLDDSKLLWFSHRAAENRGVWYAPVEKNEEQVIETVELMKKLGLNALYIQTWDGGETIYPTQNELTRQSARFEGFDVLGSFVEHCHEADIEVHAWVHNFFIGTTAAMSDPEHITVKMKEHHLVSRSGTPYNPTGYGNFVFLDPYTRECRDFVLDLYREMLSRYELDGLHLDYIRFPEPNDYSDTARDDFGYNADIIAAFAAETGIQTDPHDIYPGTQYWSEWCKFREEIINSFVGEIYDLVREVRNSAAITCAVFPDLEVTSTTIFQNSGVWLDNGWIDELFTMAYSTSVDYIVNNTVSFADVVGKNAFYSVGLGAFMEFDEYLYIKEVEAVRELWVDGTAIFSLASVNGNKLGNYIAQSVHRKPAVRTDRLEVTLSAQLNSLIDRCDGIFALSGASEQELSGLSSQLEGVLELCRPVDRDNADDICRFVDEAVAALESVDTSFANEEFGKVLEAEIGECVDCLIRSRNIYTRRAG